MFYVWSRSYAVTGFMGLMPNALTGGLLFTKQNPMTLRTSDSDDLILNNYQCECSPRCASMDEIKECDVTKHWRAVGNVMSANADKYEEPNVDNVYDYFSYYIMVCVYLAILQRFAHILQLLSCQETVPVCIIFTIQTVHASQKMLFSILTHVITNILV